MTPTEQLNLAKTSLLGLSVGDAFGETFFGPESIISDRIQDRVLQEGDWFFTDDTVMAIGIYNILSRRGVSGLGDRDTIGAIIGSVVVMATGADNIPEQWIVQTERFSSSPFFK